MVKINFLVTALAALFPLVLGAIWYSKLLFANAWIKASGVNVDEAKKGNMALVFGLTYLFCFFVAMTLNFMVIHQFSLFSILANEPDVNVAGSPINTFIVDFMAKYGNNFRTFKHGALHGTMSGILFALPVIAINAMFESKGFKYIAINAGYWIISLAVMGGIICAVV